MDKELERKLIKQWKRHLGIYLSEEYSMHGYQHEAVRVANNITDFALILHKNLNGENIPMLIEVAKKKAESRKK